MLAQVSTNQASSNTRQRISINEGWRFYKYDSSAKADDLIYDFRPNITDNKENKAADAKPTEAVKVDVTLDVLKPWILPSANDFIKISEKTYPSRRKPWQ